MEKFEHRLQRNLDLCDETLRAANFIIRESQKWLYAYQEKQNYAANPKRMEAFNLTDLRRWNDVKRKGI